MEAHTRNLSDWETEAGGSQIQSQCQQLSEVLGNLARACLYI